MQHLDACGLLVFEHADWWAETFKGCSAHQLVAIFMLQEAEQKARAAVEVAWHAEASDTQQDMLGKTTALRETIARRRITTEWQQRLDTWWLCFGEGRARIAGAAAAVAEHAEFLARLRVETVQGHQWEMLRSTERCQAAQEREREARQALGAACAVGLRSLWLVCHEAVTRTINEGLIATERDEVATRLGIAVLQSDEFWGLHGQHWDGLVRLREGAARRQIADAEDVQYGAQFLALQEAAVRTCEGPLLLLQQEEVVGRAGRVVEQNATYRHCWDLEARQRFQAVEVVTRRRLATECEFLLDVSKMRYTQMLQRAALAATIRGQHREITERCKLTIAQVRPASAPAIPFDPPQPCTALCTGNWILNLPGWGSGRPTGRTQEPHPEGQKG